MLIGWLRGLYWKVTLFLLFVYHSSCWSLTSSSMSPWIKMIIVCSVHYWFFFFSPFLWACWWMPRTFLNNCSNNNCSIHIIISFPPPDDELHSSAHLVFMMNENLDAPSLDRSYFQRRTWALSLPVIAVLDFWWDCYCKRSSHSKRFLHEVLHFCLLEAVAQAGSLLP